MTDKRILIEYIKCISCIQFTEPTEQVNKDCIGIIQDNNRKINVLYRRDTIGQYIELSYTIKYVGIAKMVKSYLSRWFVNSRFEMCEDSVRLYSIIPFLDETYLAKQIGHALHEIGDMAYVATSESNNKKYNLD